MPEVVAPAAVEVCVALASPEVPCSAVVACASLPCALVDAEVVLVVDESTPSMGETSTSSPSLRPFEIAHWVLDLPATTTDLYSRAPLPEAGGTMT